MDAATAHREWTVTSQITETRPGTAVVTIHLVNGRMGALPPFDMAVDWKPGMEAVDVEMYALGLVADAAQGLVRAAVEAGGRRGAQSS